MNKAISTPIAIIIIVVLAGLVIGTVLAYQYWWTSEEEIEEEIPEDETANWNVYRNEKAGYEIKYSPDWYFKENMSKCSFDGCLDVFHIENIEEKVIVAGDDAYITENGSYFHISVSENLKGFSSIKDKIMSYDIPEWSKQKRLENVATIEIGGEELEAWNGKGSMDEGIEFIRNNKDYSISLTSGSKEQFNKDLELYNKIISTFRFID